MTDQPRSPKRRHILSSINPEIHHKPSRKRSRSRSKSPIKTEHHDHDFKLENEDDNPAPHDRTRPRRSRFRLKDHKSSRRQRSSSRDPSQESRHTSHRHSHRHRHRRHRSPTPPNPHQDPPLSPSTAFRESLFDAMADDEGALYWEAVYGQPVHVYPNERLGPQGELERMTDEEYAAHVRQKMWEKSHAGLLEERARREQRKKAKRDEERHQRKLQQEMDESLARGEERRKRKRWERRWVEYNHSWTDWDGSPAKLPWPLDSGQQKDINEKSVRAFFVHGLSLENLGENDFVAKLKDERVRWHPDKIQQKMRGQFDDGTMKGVTEIFQIIDRLWAEMRKG